MMTTMIVMFCMPLFFFQLSGCVREVQTQTHARTTICASNVATNNKTNWNVASSKLLNE